MISVTRGVGVKNRSKIAIHFGRRTTRHVSQKEAVELAGDLLVQARRMKRVGRGL